MKIAVIGAGPAGLYFSLLAKKHDPRHEIHVVEQNPRHATYGWGVVFSDVGLAFLEEADPEFFEAFTAHHERCDYMEIVHRGTHVQVHGNHFSRTSRIDMLHTLQDACERVGVKVEYGRRTQDVEALSNEVDLVVAADGGNSAVRTQYARHFQPTFERRRNKFAWYGTHQRFHPVSLVFRETPQGVYIAHAYQYSPGLSTFLVEVDPGTWARAGLDRMSEDESRRFCTQVFAEDLGSNELLTNRSLWFEANIVRNERWTHRNIVLLGDALRTVHFSLGSGTRMAMQDAIALHRAVAGHPGDLPSAFTAFEAARRSASSTFQSAAARSLDWYETVGERLHLDPVSFAYDYMRRTGQVSHEDLRQRDPRFTAAYEQRHPQAAAA
jgi:anthraniloyl-CoA monooxygenase